MVPPNNGPALEASPSPILPASQRTPRIAVLLASMNGARWLPDQIRSILDQKGVDVQIFVSDDGSSDGSFEWLQLLSQDHHRVRLLPRRQEPSGVGSNFFYIMETAPWQDFDAVALADQDDIWFDTKLERHLRLLQEQQSVGVSGNVLALWPGGRTTLVRKNDPQTQFDYLFESSGPGCSFLLQPSFLQFFCDKVLAAIPGARNFEYHDWLLYAAARSLKHTWVIDEVPCMYYRQHDHNHIGANVGVFPALKRMRLVANKSYRSRVTDLIEICKRLSGQSVARHRSIQRLLRREGLWSRVLRARQASQFRRNRRDQLALRFFFLLGWW